MPAVGRLHRRRSIPQRRLLAAAVEHRHRGSTLLRADSARACPARKRFAGDCDCQHTPFCRHFRSLHLLGRAASVLAHDCGFGHIRSRLPGVDARKYPPLQQVADGAVFLHRERKPQLALVDTMVLLRPVGAVDPRHCGRQRGDGVHLSHDICGNVDGD